MSPHHLVEAPTVSFASDLSLDDPRADHAVEVAPRIWWVGDVLDDQFQCHPFLIEAGSSSVLIDPGSTLTIDATIRKIEEVMPLADIRTIVLHHVDPDVADGLHTLDRLITRPDARIVTEWRSQTLLRHLAIDLPFQPIEELGWKLDLDDGRELEFLLTPYLHFPGAFVTYQATSQVLFSSDLFGGFNRARTLWADGPEAFEDLRQFHEHYMPSREILMAGLASIRARFPDIRTILPQHGYMIDRPLVEPMFRALNQLECGIMLMSRSDAHLARVLEMAGAVRRIEDALESGAPLGDIEPILIEHLAHVLPAVSFSFECRDHDGGSIIRFSHVDRFEGVAADDWSSPSPSTITLDLPRIDGEPAIAVVIGLDGPGSLSTEAASLLLLSAPHVRRVVAQAVQAHEAGLDRKRLTDTAHHDPLTGLLNRRVFDDEARSPARATRAVIMIDIDRFKVTNDTFGHAVGDEVLRLVAEAIVACVRPDDLVIRYGGEEIVCLAEANEHGDEHTALMLGERIRVAVEAVDASTLTPGKPLTVSVGVTVQHVAEAMADAFLRADAGLYRAKDEGRNTVRFI